MTIAIEIFIPQMTSSCEFDTIAGEVRASGSASAIEAGWMGLGCYSTASWPWTSLNGNGQKTTGPFSTAMNCPRASNLWLLRVPSQGVSVRPEAPKQSFKPFFKALKESKSRGDWCLRCKSFIELLDVFLGTRFIRFPGLRILKGCLGLSKTVISGRLVHDYRG